MTSMNCLCRCYLVLFCCCFDAITACGASERILNRKRQRWTIVKMWRTPLLTFIPRNTYAFFSFQRKWCCCIFSIHISKISLHKSYINNERPKFKNYLNFNERAMVPPKVECHHKFIRGKFCLKMSCMKTCTFVWNM